MGLQMFRIIKEIFSINKMYTRKVTYKKEFYQWREDFCSLIYKDKEVLEDIRKRFDPKKHAFTVHMTRYVPIDKFYTQSGSINKNSGDLTNHEKTVIDSIFIPSLSNNPKY